MIAKVFRGSGFAGLQGYLLRGTNGRDADRVLWTATRNLASDDPERAAPVMRATAEQSARVEKPVWHLTLAAEPGAQLDREGWERVADRVLKDLGLDEHQVLIVAHGDTKHPHIHLLVNRVHPESCRAWSTSHDYRRLEKALRNIEREFHLREVPGNLYRFEPAREPDRSESRTSGEVREARRTGEVTWGDRARANLRSEFRDARSWADLRGRLEEQGYRLESRGRGLVVTDGERSIKASRIARSASAHRLAERFGQSYSDWSRARHDALTAATEVRTAGELLTAAERAAAAGDRLARVANEAQTEYRQARLRNAEAAQRLSRDLGVAYRDPREALRAMVQHHRERGWLATAKVLENEPATFGRLQGTALARGRREALTAAHRAAHSARQLAHLRPERARLAGRAHKARRDYRSYEHRAAARRARVARQRSLAAQRNLAAAVRRGTKDLAMALPAEARRAVNAALQLTQPPTVRTAVAKVAGPVLPRGAATAALAFGASALRFALAPSPLSAAKAVGDAARTARELGRDGDPGHER